MIKDEQLFAVGDVTQSDRCLHTPSIFAKQNLLYVQEVGNLKSLKPHRCIREGLDSFLFLLVVEGKGTIYVKNKKYEVSKGDCALIDCMEHYEHISDEEDAWALSWVHFNGKAARGYFELFMENNDNQNIFSEKDIEWWKNLLSELLKVQQDRNLQAELYCGELLQKLMNHIINCVLNSAFAENEKERNLVNKVRELINIHYAKPDVMQMVENKTRKKIDVLEPIFSKWFGISIEKYVNNRRFNAAKELLRFSIKTVEEVTLESGISNVAALQREFQENEGMTAEEYRAKWAQWIR